MTMKNPIQAAYARTDLAWTTPNRDREFGGCAREPAWCAHRIERALSGQWFVIAEQVTLPDHTHPYDVWLELRNPLKNPDADPRVPLGPNLHAEPGKEMDRLAGVIEAPLYA
jgi:hypothetical protein